MINAKPARRSIMVGVYRERRRDPKDQRIEYYIFPEWIIRSEQTNLAGEGTNRFRHPKSLHTVGKY